MLISWPNKKMKDFIASKNGNFKWKIWVMSQMNSE